MTPIECEISDEKGGNWSLHIDLEPRMMMNEKCWVLVVTLDSAKEAEGIISDSEVETLVGASDSGDLPKM